MKNITMYKFIFIFYSASVFLFNSCKSDLEKIDINDVDAHRTYQDSLINSGNSLFEKFRKVRELITEYKKLNPKENISNSNYNYYLARLYSKVDDFPLIGYWIDTINNKFLNYKDYSNFYDSTFFYAEKALELKRDNISAMSILCMKFYNEKLKYEFNRLIVPISYKRNQKLWGKRLNYIVNNAQRFITDKYTSETSLYLRSICEIAMDLVGKQISIMKGGYYFDETNEEKVKLLILYGVYWDFIKDTNPKTVQINKEFVGKNIYPNIILAQNHIKEKEELTIKINLTKELIENIYHKYSYVDYNEDGSKVAAMLTLDKNNNYTQAATINGFTQSGRGTFYVTGTKLVLNRSSGVAIDGEMYISVGKDRKLYLKLYNGVVYVEDDDSYYLKKMIATPQENTAVVSDLDRNNKSNSSFSSDLIFNGTAKEYHSGITKDYTLLIKSDFSAASLGGGPYIAIQDQGDGSYIWLDGTIIGMGFRISNRKCVVFGSDGSYFCTLYRR